MTLRLVTYRLRKYHTTEDNATILVSDTIESEVDYDFEPTREGIENFKKWHEGEVSLMSWSEIEE